MNESTKKQVPIAEWIARYDDHLSSVRGLARDTRSLHRLVVQKFLHHRFPNGQVTWDDLRFRDCLTFLENEFTRLHHRETQRAWLMVLRSVLRYLAAEGYIPGGWDAALPRIPVYRQASLPRSLSEKQLADLERACRGDKPRHLRYRALLLLFHRLGLRAGEAANLHLEDVDWRSGCLRIRSTKNHHERLLPLPDDVGTALAAHLRASQPHSQWVFEPKRPPFSTERVYWHVHNSMVYLFGLAGIARYGIHALRHTAASEMVRGGASFKAVAEILGHKSISTTLIYAKLNAESLAQVALPWPGGAR
jgi:site-specific recombinase XerD